MRDNLKILHLFNTYLPNTENWAYHLISTTPNVDIFIAAKNYIEGSFPNRSFTFYHHPYEKIESHYIGLSKRNPIQFLQKLYIRLFKYPKLLLDGIDAFARKNDIDIIHVHFANMGWFYRQIAQNLGKPLVISFYGWDYEQLPYLYPKYKKRFKILFAQADAFICEGPHGAKILASYGCPQKKIKVVKLGVETEKIKFVHRAKKANELNLIQLATFTQKKGHIYTVQAFKHALHQCPNMHLTLVGGDAGTKEEINIFIRDNELQDKITIMDAIDHTLLYSFLADYQVFIQPSCYSDDLDCEGGAPIALLDAQATGMPVIGTTHCDIPLEVLNNQTGLLSAEKDAEALAKNITYFYNIEQSEYNIFSKAARKHISTKFNIKKNAKNLQLLYVEIKNQ